MTTSRAYASTEKEERAPKLAPARARAAPERWHAGPRTRHARGRPAARNAGTSRRPCDRASRGPHAPTRTSPTPHEPNELDAAHHDREHRSPSPATTPNSTIITTSPASPAYRPLRLPLCPAAARFTPTLSPTHPASAHARSRSSPHALPPPRLRPSTITPGLACPVFLWQVEEGGSSAKRWTPLPRKPRRKAKSGPEAGRRPVRLLRRTPRDEHQEPNTQRRTGSPHYALHSHVADCSCGGEIFPTRQSAKRRAESSRCLSRIAQARPVVPPGRCGACLCRAHGAAGRPALLHVVQGGRLVASAETTASDAKAAVSVRQARTARSAGEHSSVLPPIASWRQKKNASTTSWNAALALPSAIAISGPQSRKGMSTRSAFSGAIARGDFRSRGIALITRRRGRGTA